MEEKIEVNRKIKLKYLDQAGEAKLYDTRIKYIDTDNIEVLAPVEVSDINSLVDEEVTIDEETIGKSVVTHKTVLKGQSEEILEATGERLIVLERPVTLQIREFARVDVNFPLTVNIIDSETTDTEGKDMYEALTVNLSASGILFVVGLDEETVIDPGQNVVLSFDIQRKNEENIKLENISAKIVRTYELEMGDLKRKHIVAVTFSNLTTEQQNKIMHYVLDRQLKLKSDDLLEVGGSSPVYEQLALLKDEVQRLQEQLQMAHEQIKLTEDARQRSDNIIVQMTRRLSSKERKSQKHRWWRFWQWFS